MYEGRSWQAAEFGAPKDVMRVVETTWSDPREGQVLIRVRAAGVGFADVLQVLGHYPGVTPPVVPGLEVAGEVVAVAPGSEFAVGERVMGITPAALAEPHGGYSDYAYVFEGRTLRIPAALSFEEAAGFMIPFRTAYQALTERIRMEPGEVLAILGAGGAVGSAAIQLGKALGATVIAIAGGEEKLKFCVAAGADHGVNHQEQDVAAELKRLTGGAGVDVLLDPVGGDLATRALQGVGIGGRVPVAGFASGSFLSVDAADLLMRNYAVVGVYGGGTTPEQDAVANRRLIELVEEGAIRTPVGVVSGFDEVPDLLSRLTSGGPAGKHIIRVS
jgi:NADPH2:quinone reductase